VTGVDERRSADTMRWILNKKRYLSIQCSETILKTRERSGHTGKSLLCGIKAQGGLTASHVDNFGDLRLLASTRSTSDTLQRLVNKVIDAKQGCCVDRLKPHGYLDIRMAISLWSWIHFRCAVIGNCRRTHDAKTFGDRKLLCSPFSPLPVGLSRYAVFSAQHL
jgi:hypothetical protein